MAIDLAAMALASEEFRAVSQRSWEAKANAANVTGVELVKSQPAGSVAHVRRLQRQGQEHSQFRLYAEASGCFKRALSMSRELAFAVGEQSSLQSLRSLRRILSASAASSPSAEQAYAHSELALSLAELSHDRPGEMACLTTLGELDTRLGRYESAVYHMEAAVEIASDTTAA